MAGSKVTLDFTFSDETKKQVEFVTPGSSVAAARYI